MKRLEKKEIIDGYTTNIDPKKLGFTRYFLFIDYKLFHSTYQKFLGFCKINSLVVEMHRLFGSWQVIIEILSPDRESCLEVVNELQKLNAPMINGIELVSSENSIKNEFLPEKVLV
jgi:DNA-binding Lrp family transcriptional regulator